MNWEIPDGKYNESRTALLNNYMLLTTEVSEVAEEFRAVFNKTAKIAKENEVSEEEAFRLSKECHQENIGKELADCIAYIVKFANYFEIDLEDSIYKKMHEVKHRVNKDQE
nr:MazG nucleotide pyrophosphohydrolase domain-containing protein [Bacillus suaedae]